MDRAEALQALPSSYAIALRLRDEGVEPDAVARVLDLEPEAVDPLLTLAEAKLAGLMSREADKRSEAVKASGKETNEDAPLIPTWPVRAGGVGAHVRRGRGRCV